MKKGIGEDWESKYTQVKKALFEHCKTLGGIITAEHGVGIHKIEDLHYCISQKEINLMKNIKTILGSKMVLNPEKIFPQAEKIN